MLSKIITAINKERSKRKQGASSLRSWYADKYQTVVIQRNLLALITISSLLCIMVGLFTVISISSNKKILPFVIEIEDKTGIVHIVNPATIQQYTAEDALLKSFIVQYVRGREGYDPNRYRENFYQTVRIMSSDRVYGAFKSQIDLKNPSSPILRFGTAFTRVVEFKSVNLKKETGNNVISAQVRFVVQGDGLAGRMEPEHKIAIVDFEFRPNLEFNFDERNANPLGFTVVSYRVDQDAVQ